MAHRFHREGDFIKHRARAEFMGIRPFMEDLKWRAVDWHYQFYMRDKARKAILSRQREAPKLQFVADMRFSGKSTKFHTGDFEIQATRYFTWTTFLPNIVPNRVSTNPFCKESANTTGWKETVSRRIPDPLPRGRAFVSGTDDSVPVMPRLR